MRNANQRRSRTNTARDRYREVLVGHVLRRRIEFRAVRARKQGCPKRTVARARVRVTVTYRDADSDLVHGGLRILWT